MSGERRDPGTPPDPSWSPELLADLHAGVLDDEAAEQLRQRVAEDAEAQHVLAALDATSADLADAPPIPIPDDVAARIDAALEQEVRAWSAASPEPSLPSQDVGPGQGPSQDAGTGSGTVVDLAARRRRRRWTWGGVGVLAAAAAVVGIALVPATLTNNQSSDQASGQPPTQLPEQSGPPPLALHDDAQGGVTLSQDEFSEALQSQQYLGDLRDPERLLACLRANGVNGGKPIGAREVTVDGQRAQLFILSTGRLAQFRLLTVGPNCGPNVPATISDSTFGG